MRTIRSAILLAALSTIPVLAQSTHPTAKKPSSDQNGKSIHVTGCVAADEADAARFTLADDTGATTYRLSGKDVREYLGKRVEVVGNERSKLKIVGGLTPSPNIAGQAGAIDPTRAAMAAQGAEGNAQPGNILVPEFHVTAVKAVPGGCMPK
jgi:Protein of unknown function (DUF5818)